jgi:hypothetical protein
MGIALKGRRKLIVDGRPFVWHVRVDDDSADLVLHVASADKHFLVRYHLGQPEDTRYLTVIGPEFSGVVRTEGIHRFFTCPRWEFESGTITPRSVRELILWSLADTEPRNEVDWTGKPVVAR